MLLSSVSCYRLLASDELLQEDQSVLKLADNGILYLEHSVHLISIDFGLVQPLHFGEVSLHLHHGLQGIDSLLVVDLVLLLGLSSLSGPFLSELVRDLVVNLILYVRLEVPMSIVDAVHFVPQVVHLIADLILCPLYFRVEVVAKLLLGVLTRLETQDLIVSPQNLLLLLELNRKVTVVLDEPLDAPGDIPVLLVDILLLWERIQEVAQIVELVVRNLSLQGVLNVVNLLVLLLHRSFHLLLLVLVLVHLLLQLYLVLSAVFGHRKLLRNFVKHAFHRIIQLAQLLGSRTLA